MPLRRLLRLIRSGPIVQGFRVGHTVGIFDLRCKNFKLIAVNVRPCHDQLIDRDWPNRGIRLNSIVGQLMPQLSAIKAFQIIAANKRLLFSDIPRFDLNAFAQPVRLTMRLYFGADWISPPIPIHVVN